MKNIFLIATAVLCLCACEGKKASDICLDAVRAEIVRLTGPDAKVHIEKFERVDSTTFGQELEHRKSVFAAREAQNRKLYDDYVASGLQKNAEKKRLALAKDAVVRAGLDAIVERLAKADSLNVTAYYDYHFSGNAVSNGRKTVFEDYYAAISPDGKVLATDSSSKELHKTLGRVIPGYAALVNDF